MLSKPLGHHSSIHWMKTTTTTTTPPTTTCAHTPPRSRSRLLAFTCTITMCSFALFGFAAPNHCDFVVHSVFFCHAPHLSVLYLFIYLFLNPLPPTLHPTPFATSSMCLCLAMLLLLSLPAVVCTCFGT